MLAFVYSGPWQVALKNSPEPCEPRGLQVLVNIKATGVCGTDLGIISGAYSAKVPVILGHESAGVVVAIGENVTSLRPGCRVVIDPTYHCGYCEMCRSGRQNHCEQKHVTEAGVSTDGTFAPFFMTEERFLYKLADHVSFSEATLTEPLSCVLTGINQLRLFPGQRTLVVGAGPIGLLYVSALNLRGISGTIIEVSPWRREQSSSILGDRWSVVGTMEEATALAPGRDGVFDLAVDTTGRMAARLIPLLRRGGQLLLVGLRDDKVSFNPGDLANRSLSILGSIDSLGTFAGAGSLIASGAVPARKIVSHRFPLDDILSSLSLLGCDVKNQTCDYAANAMKVVIETA